MSKLYTIGDASRVLGMPASTIRFYGKNGLLPHMGRTESGIRMFTEDDLNGFASLRGSRPPECR